MAASIEQVGADLRRRRRALVGFEQPTREGWAADLVAYDRLLIAAAVMLDVSAPDEPHGAEPLTARQRDDVERGLAEAGLDIRIADL